MAKGYLLFLQEQIKDIIIIGRGYKEQILSVSDREIVLWMSWMSWMSQMSWMSRGSIENTPLVIILSFSNLQKQRAKGCSRWAVFQPIPLEHRGRGADGLPSFTP